MGHRCPSDVFPFWTFRLPIRTASAPEHGDTFAFDRSLRIDQIVPRYPQSMFREFYLLRYLCICDSHKCPSAHIGKRQECGKSRSLFETEAEAAAAAATAAVVIMRNRVPADSTKRKPKNVQGGYGDTNERRTSFGGSRLKRSTETHNSIQASSGTSSKNSSTIFFPAETRSIPMVTGVIYEIDHRRRPIWNL
uniref:Uncharacterized protein n=1 Tax=Anopheles culicifacies TaxID=139723 RepID=A0A182LYY2_9DIPT